MLIQKNTFILFLARITEQLKEFNWRHRVTTHAHTTQVKTTSRSIHLCPEHNDMNFTQPTIFQIQTCKNKLEFSKPETVVCEKRKLQYFANRFVSSRHQSISLSSIMTDTFDQLPIECETYTYTCACIHEWTYSILSHFPVVLHREGA